MNGISSFYRCRLVAALTPQLLPERKSLHFTTSPGERNPADCAFFPFLFDKNLRYTFQARHTWTFFLQAMERPFLISWNPFFLQTACSVQAPATWRRMRSDFLRFLPDFNNYCYYCVRQGEWNASPDFAMGSRFLLLEDIPLFFGLLLLLLLLLLLPVGIGTVIRQSIGREVSFSYWAWLFGG